MCKYSIANEDHTVWETHFLQTHQMMVSLAIRNTLHYQCQAKSLYTLQFVLEYGKSVCTCSGMKCCCSVQNVLSVNNFLNGRF
jgi:hypothetical protein